MNKPPLPDLARPDLVQLLQEAETVTGIKALMIEKDAWVCWTLRQLFALPDARAHFIVSVRPGSYDIGSLGG